MPSAARSYGSEHKEYSVPFYNKILIKIQFLLCKLDLHNTRKNFMENPQLFLLPFWYQTLFKIPIKTVLIN